MGQFLPRHLTDRAAALPDKAAAPTVRHRDPGAAGSSCAWRSRRITPSFNPVTVVSLRQGRIAIYDSIEKVQALRDSPEYQALVPLRDKAADYRSYIVEGAANWVAPLRRVMP
jgi:uncharacterized protein DUF1330